MHPRKPSTHLLSILLALVAGFLLSPSSAHAQVTASPCAADITGDHVVDAADLASVLIDWGLAGKGLAADIDGDGVVNGDDMAAVLNHWGAVCPEITGASPASGGRVSGSPASSSFAERSRQVRSMARQRRASSPLGQRGVGGRWCSGPRCS